MTKNAKLFTQEEWEMMYDGTFKNHIDLLKWLYDKHKKILREYENTKGKMHIEFMNTSPSLYEQNNSQQPRISQNRGGELKPISVCAEMDKYRKSVV